MTDGVVEPLTRFRSGIAWRLGLVLFGMGAAAALWAVLRHPTSAVAALAPGAPSLFESERPCPRTSRARELGRELEARGRLRADRYPYDPRDGVAALRRHQEAISCYRFSGSTADVARVESAALTLATRVQTDYAAARMNLMRALESRRWAEARAEARQLLLFTEHLGEHDYVEWLEGTMGWLTAGERLVP
ncbi:MAG TPA: hypothetical protein VLS88_09000 [Polyangiales bacterium]|nr:hypothetical protein [Polyangiales bacterium]